MPPTSKRPRITEPEEVQSTVHILLLIENSGDMRDHREIFLTDQLEAAVETIRWFYEEERMSLFYATTSTATDQPLLSHIHRSTARFPSFDIVDSPTNVLTPEMIRTRINEFINKGAADKKIVRHVVVAALSDSVSDEALNLSPDHPDSWATLANFLFKSDILFHIIWNPVAKIEPLHKVFMRTMNLQGRQNESLWDFADPNVCRFLWSTSLFETDTSECMGLGPTIVRRALHD